MKTGSQILETILASIIPSDEIVKFGEVVNHSGFEEVRNCLEARGILCIQEFEEADVPSFDEKQVRAPEIDEKSIASPDKIEHLYRIARGAREFAKSHIQTVYRDASNKRNRKLIPTGFFRTDFEKFAEYCSQREESFENSLKPAVKHLIQTPIFTFEFPVISGTRYIEEYDAESNHTAVIINTHHICSEAADIIRIAKEIKWLENKAQEYLVKEMFYQPVQIIQAAIAQKQDLQNLFRRYIELNKKMEDIHKQSLPKVPTNH